MVKMDKKLIWVLCGVLLITLVGALLTANSIITIDKDLKAVLDKEGYLNYKTSEVSCDKDLCGFVLSIDNSLYYNLAFNNPNDDNKIQTLRDDAVLDLLNRESTSLINKDISNMEIKLDSGIITLVGK